MPRILGVKIDNLNMTEALLKLECLLANKHQCYGITPNPDFLIRAHQDNNFHQILNEADLSVADGIGVVWCSRLIGEPLKERITGVDLMKNICQLAALKKWQILLIGASLGISQKAADVLKKTYPSLIIKAVDNRGLEDLNYFKQFSQKNKHTILFVALGSPKQELWIRQNIEKIPYVNFAIGIGGSFNLISGKIRRAPQFFQKNGLEWVWRTICEPKRIKKALSSSLYFPYLVFRNRH